MVTAAKNFSFGDGELRHFFTAGDEIPEEVASEIPSSLILEELAKDAPEELSRDQLMMMAGVGPYAEDGDPSDHYEMDEEELRDALGNLRTKADLVEWMAQVRPDFDELDTEAQTRAEMVDLIVEEMIGD